MTEDLAIPSFGLTSARPNTVRKRVGGVPGLRRTLKVTTWVWIDGHLENVE
jgi:hypothetical protein